MQKRLWAVLMAALPMGAILAPSPGWGWGHTGHVQLSAMAMRHLPDDLPAFLRSPAAIADVAELGAEPDVSRTTGTISGATANGRLQAAPTVHDSERDPGHYINADQDGTILGGVVKLGALPPTRGAYDTAQRQGGQTQYTAGYLPYTIIDGWQQVRKDFGIWRAMQAGLAAARTDADRAWFTRTIALRERLIIRDIGTWSHYVTDGSQPLHVSIHFNGWGRYPNPNGYTNYAIHGPMEGAFVRRFIDFGAVEAAMAPPRDCGCAIEQRVPAYLTETLSHVVAVYEAGGAGDRPDLYRTAQPAEVALVTARLAAGASELRDQIIMAWRQSGDIAIGYPLVRVSDAVAGTVLITPATFGAD